MKYSRHLFQGKHLDLEAIDPQNIIFKNIYEKFTIIASFALLLFCLCLLPVIVPVDIYRNVVIRVRYIFKNKYRK